MRRPPRSGAAGSPRSAAGSRAQQGTGRRGAHAGSERQVGEHGQRAELELATRVEAVGTGLERHAGVLRAEPVEGSVEEVAGEVEAGLAVASDAAQNLFADLIQAGGAR